MTNPKTTPLYRKITGLTEITEANLDKLFASAIRSEVAKGKIIIEQGKVCDKVVFVESGYLRAYVTKDGIEINTDFIFENNFATNLKSLRSSIPSDTTVQAGEAAIVYEFNKNRLLALYKESREIESFGRKLLEQLLIDQEEHSNLFKLYSPSERYRYLQTNKPDILQRVSLSQISSYLGIARETLTRIRKKG